MCFLTYICYYLFLFHTLFYYKNGNWVFHLMEVLLYQVCVNVLRTWSSFAGMLFCCTKLSVKLLSELRYQDMISAQCNVNNLLPNVAFSKAILSHENSMSIFSGKYTYPCVWLQMRVWLQIQGSQVRSRSGPILSWRLIMKSFLRSFSSLPLIYSRRVVVSYKRKYVHELLVNRLFKPAQEKVWLGELTVPPWP